MGDSQTAQSLSSKFRSTDQYLSDLNSSVNEQISGNVEQISTNKVRGVRAALVWSIATAELAREHNDANVIAIGARQHTFDEAASFIDRFIETPFSEEERHARRIAQIAAFEADGTLEPDPRAAAGQPDVLAADDSSFDPEAG